MEKLSDIEEELRSLSKCEEYRIDAKYAGHQPTVSGKPVVVYFGEIADRILEARKRDERLMLSLMLYAVEDYCEEWATARFKQAVTDACERLGIEYRTDANPLQEQIEEKIAAIAGEARVMCKLAPSRRCVDCELCKGEGGAA